MAKFYTKSSHVKTCISVVHKTDNCSLHYLTYIVSETVVVFYNCYPNDSVVIFTVVP